MICDAYAALAAVYDELMYDVDYAAWAAYLGDLLSKYAKGKHVCEVACGTGNLSIPLAKKGYQLIGMDQSEEMLMVAQKKARMAGKQMQFIRQDMQQLNVPKQDAIVCGMDGVNYLLSKEDVFAFFRRALACLKPGGMLAFDISSDWKLSHLLAGQVFCDETEHAAYLWRNDYDAETRLLSMDLTLFIKQGNYYERKEETQVQRAHGQQELLQWLKEAGFAQAFCFEFLKEEIPDAKAERLQFLALKG